MPRKEAIIETLRDCYDPEIPINVVDLGLIYNIEIKSGSVEIKMTLTALGCPLSETIIQDMKQRVAMLKGVKDVTIEIVFDPPWSPDKMSQEARKILGV